MVIGLGVSLVGVADGVVMAFHRKVATCPDGHYFPQGTTNFNCYVHPHLGVGIAIVVVSVLLGLLTVLVAISAAALFRSAEGQAVS
jgi:hypothetical protein